MDMRERRNKQLAYIADEAVMEEQVRCSNLYSRTSDLPGYA